MKISFAALAICALPLVAQETPAGELKHLVIPTDMRLPGRAWLSVRPTGGFCP